MKIDNNKISAFTVGEMVVVLILTSIVVGLAFSVLSLVQKHISGIQNNFINTTELNKLEQSLWLDFNRYSKIKYNDLDEGLIFANELDSISYQFYDSYIIKEQDTFHIPLQDKTMFFNGNQIEWGYIDAIKLETTKTMQNQHLFVFKDNDATSFMN
jgi:type II secretory pathway component PulJ